MYKYLTKYLCLICNGKINYQMNKSQMITPEIINAYHLFNKLIINNVMFYHLINYEKFIFSMWIEFNISYCYREDNKSMCHIYVDNFKGNDEYILITYKNINNRYLSKTVKNIKEIIEHLKY